MADLQAQLLEALLRPDDGEAIEIQLTEKEECAIIDPVFSYCHEAGDSSFDAVAEVLSVAVGKRIILSGR